MMLNSGKAFGDALRSLELRSRRVAAAKKTQHGGMKTVTGDPLSKLIARKLSPDVVGDEKNQAACEGAPYQRTKSLESSNRAVSANRILSPIVRFSCSTDSSD